MSYLKQYVFLSNLIHFFKKIGQKMRECKQKKKQNKTKPLFRGGGGLKGVVSKMVFLKLLTVQSLSRPILCPGIDLGSMNLHVFSLSKLKFRFLLFEKQSF